MWAAGRTAPAPAQGPELDAVAHGLTQLRGLPKLGLIARGGYSRVTRHAAVRLGGAAATRAAAPSPPHTKTNPTVAVKRCSREQYGRCAGLAGLAVHALREAAVAAEVGGRHTHTAEAPPGLHACWTPLLDVFYAKGHVHTVAPAADCDLYEGLRHLHAALARGDALHAAAAGGQGPPALRRDAFSVDTVACLTQVVLQGLMQLHAHGWVNQDVKPSNVLLLHAEEGDAAGQRAGSRRSGCGAATLCDMGMAAAAYFKTTVSRSGSVIEAVEEPGGRDGVALAPAPGPSSSSSSGVHAEAAWLKAGALPGVQAWSEVTDASAAADAVAALGAAAPASSGSSDDSGGGGGGSSYGGVGAAPPSPPVPKHKPAPVTVTRVGDDGEIYTFTLGEFDVSDEEEGGGGDEEAEADAAALAAGWGQGPASATAPSSPSPRAGFQAGHIHTDPQDDEQENEFFDPYPEPLPKRRRVEGGAFPQVVSLRYRAPELLAAAPVHGPAVDCWAAGVLLAEALRTAVLVTLATSGVAFLDPAGPPPPPPPAPALPDEEDAEQAAALGLPPAATTPGGPRQYRVFGEVLAGALGWGGGGGSQPPSATKAAAATQPRVTPPGCVGGLRLRLSDDFHLFPGSGGELEVSVLIGKLLGPVGLPQPAFEDDDEGGDEAAGAPPSLAHVVWPGASYLGGFIPVQVGCSSCGVGVRRSKAGSSNSVEEDDTPPLVARGAGGGLTPAAAWGRCSAALHAGACGAGASSPPRWHRDALLRLRAAIGLDCLYAVELEAPASGGAAATLTLTSQQLGVSSATLAAFESGFELAALLLTMEPAARVSAAAAAAHPFLAAAAEDAGVGAISHLAAFTLAAAAAEAGKSNTTTVSAAMVAAVEGTGSPAAGTAAAAAIAAAAPASPPPALSLPLPLAAGFRSPLQAAQLPLAYYGGSAAGAQPPAAAPPLPPSGPSSLLLQAHETPAHPHAAGGGGAGAGGSWQGLLWAGQGDGGAGGGVGGAVAPSTGTLHANLVSRIRLGTPQ